MNDPQMTAMIQLLHVKVNAAVSMANMTLDIVSKTQLKPSSQARVERHRESINEEIGKAVAQFESAAVPSIGWWVTNHDAPEASKRVSGPYTTSADAGRAREILERFEHHHNYWIEALAP